MPSCKITKVNLSIPLEFLVLNVVPYAEFLRHMTAWKGQELGRRWERVKKRWDSYNSGEGGDCPSLVQFSWASVNSSCLSEVSPML